jgi:hypothetical protein
VAICLSAFTNPADHGLRAKEPTLCAMHTTTGAPAPDVFSTSQLANARVIPEQGALVLITRSGDIVTWSTQDAVGEVRAPPRRRLS